MIAMSNAGIVLDNAGPSGREATDRPDAGTVQRLRGSCRPGKHRFWICERPKSVAEP